jgi:uncharacterized membrane protein (UPF0127 family)
LPDRSRFVRVRNVSRGTVIAERCRVAQGLRERVLGLHLWPQLESGEALLLPGANSIDTTFMKYAMDAIFIDERRRVTKVVHVMKPWRIVPLARGATDCIELPAGAAAASATQVGDQLDLEDLGQPS